ncbi:hypothetical protein [Nonomuraea rhizosphaerae]|uniref:hypothetical protein n=1 Tax=Nonomuraea rhizosphaerae TaxID=2665663 RepID=UPI001C5DE97C|nr:hypothetical protein [Nonomuraea rhizosphaerae]
MTVVGRAMIVTVVMAGSIVLGGSAQAAVEARQAADSGEITSPSDGQVVTSGSVSISAHTGVMQLSMGVYVEGPSTSRQKVASGGANQTISGTFNPGDAPNGTFNVILKGEITNSTYATSTFKLRRPAATPSGVSAALQGSGKNEKIVVTWSKGSEPDLQSYEVATTLSGIVGRLPADSACSGSSCKATLAVPSKAAGQRVGFTVKAFRGDGDGGSIGSGNSGATYVNIPAPPTAKPKKTATKQRDPKAGTRKGVETLPTLSNRQTQPTAAPTRKAKSTNNLPAMPDTDPKGNLPIPTASTGDTGRTDGLTPDGTNGDASTGVDTAVKAQSSESSFGTIGQYGLYVAGGLLLLLLAAHAGAWARRRSLAAASATESPAARATPVVSVASPSTGGTSPQSTSSSAGTTSPRRRPAVVLAVTKVRPPDETRRTGTGTGTGAGTGTGTGTGTGAGTDAAAQFRMSDRSGTADESRTPKSPSDTPEGRSRTPERSSRAPYGRSQGQDDRSRPPYGPAQGQDDRSRSQDDRSQPQGERPRAQDERLRAQAQRMPMPELPPASSERTDGSRPMPELARASDGSSDEGTSVRGDVRTPEQGRQRTRMEPISDRPDSTTASGPTAANGSTTVSGPMAASGSTAAIGRAGADGRAGETDRVGQNGRNGRLASESSEPNKPDRAKATAAERPRAALPLHLSDADLRFDPDEWMAIDQRESASADAVERERPDQDDPEGREPMWISLPSSAVTEVPESAATVVPPAVRIEDRWDDYLPPSPRSMEDSGFWERPQPGAVDFWAADEDENALAGHRHRGGDS